MATTLHLTDNESEQDRSAIFNALIAFNIDEVGDAGYRPLNVIIRDNDRSIGGLWGHTAYGWLGIVYFVVPETLRNCGLGTSIIDTAESEARKRKCHSAYVDTHEFQAREFYEKCGYELFGELADFPKGYKRYYLKKSLNQ